MYFYFLSNMYKYAKGRYVYTGHVTKYGISKYEIENLEKSSILMNNLEKVGWVLLKSGYNIVPYGQLENTYII